MKQSPSPCIRGLLLLLPLLLVLQRPAAWAADSFSEVRSGRASILADHQTSVSTGEQEVSVPETAPLIEVWYGDSQNFGHLGNPQRQINILGNVSPQRQMYYSLNGGPYIEIGVGEWGCTMALAAEGGVWQLGGMSGDPEDFDTDGLTGLTALTSPRLECRGDFAVEIDTSDLNDGANTVVLMAGANESTKTVTVNYSAGNVWPEPYTIDWSEVTDILDVAQVVDGEWEIREGMLRTVQPGYDRLVAIGDVVWDDFEVTVPITVHEWQNTNDGGVGILARWQGHFQVADEQPAVGWWEIGAYGFYRHKDEQHGGSRLALFTGLSDRYFDQSGFTLRLNRPYYFKMRVQTKDPALSGFYSLKVWRADSPEPSDWVFEVQDRPPEELFSGSFLLVAHRADVSFGDVEVVPVLDVAVSTVGNGGAQISPGLGGVSDAYLYGDTIMLTATADPGWAFGGWSGDLTGYANPVTLVLTDDLEVTASFGLAHNLNVDVVGNGTVDLDPPGPVYAEGVVVTLTPTPDLGWGFSHWSGPGASAVVDNGDGTWSLTIDGDKSVTANFSQDEYDVTITYAGGGAGQVINLPGNPYLYGEEATLTPVPATSAIFGGWSGPDAGDLNDNGDGTWSLAMDGNKALTATFVFTARIIYLPMIIRDGQ